MAQDVAGRRTKLKSRLAREEDVDRAVTRALPVAQGGWHERGGYVGAGSRGCAAYCDDLEGFESTSSYYVHEQRDGVTLLVSVQQSTFRTDRVQREALYR